MEEKELGDNESVKKQGQASVDDKDTGVIGLNMMLF